MRMPHGDGQAPEHDAAEPQPAAEEGCGETSRFRPLSGRRQFLQRLTLSLGGTLGAVVAIPWVGVFLSPLIRTAPSPWRPVGRVDDFPLDGTVKVTYLDAEPHPWAGFAAESAAWVRRESEDEFVGFAAYCSHVGCPIRWEEGPRLFMCPCHGGAFYADGSVAAGPPPRSLDRYPVRIRDGTVEIQAVGVRAEEV